MPAPPSGDRQAARRALTLVQVILTEELEESLTELLAAGETLVRYADWAGAESDRFRRGTWPGCAASIRRTLANLRGLERELPAVTASVGRATDDTRRGPEDG